METINPTIEEKSENLPKKVFLEVGTWEIPVPFMGGREFGDDELYLGIDKDMHLVRRARKLSSFGPNKKEKPTFIQADAESLPIRGDSVEEFFLGNVLGDPSISIKSKKAFLKEAHRALRENGRLIIKETNTPPLPKDLEKIFRMEGFRRVKLLRPGDPDWKKEIAQYQITAQETSLGMGDFLAIFEKEKIEK